MPFKLVMMDQGKPIRAFPVNKSELLLGSVTGCDIKLRADEVDEKHCMFKFRADKLEVADLGGAKGTFVNGERLGGSVKLTVGDKLRVGSVMLEVHRDEDNRYLTGKRLLHRLYGAMPPFRPEDLREWDQQQLKEQVLVRLNTLVTSHMDEMPPESELDRLVTELLGELTDLGPLKRLMTEDGVSEVMINGRDQIFVEKGGRLLKARKLAFDSDEHVTAVARQILAPLGKTVDRRTPMADARMPDGSRVNVVIPPLATVGPTITIRRFSKTKITGDDLVRFGSLSPNMLRFLQVCVRERISMVVAGGTGSGKTTLLNVLSSFIPAAERIVTIEDAAELSLDQDHVVSLEARTSGLGPGEEPVHIRDLVKNSLRMRPDRIVVGECRGGEALDMLQAMNTGHEGSMTTVHANSPRDVLARLETLIMMAGYELPIGAIRHQIASAVTLIVMQSRFRDGSRKVTQINEITGIQNDTLLMSELFSFKVSGYSAEGELNGRFACTGFVPKCMQDLREAGVNIDLGMFAQAGIDRTI